MAKKPVKVKKQLAHKRTLGSVISFERRRTLEGWCFSAPWLIGFLIFTLVPLILSVRIIFYITQLTDLYGFEGQSKWVGFENYIDIIQDPSVGEAMVNSFLDALWPVSYTHLDVYKRQEPCYGYDGALRNQIRG